MNSKIKRILAVLLSAVMVMSVAFISTAAGPRYERPELNKADTVKTTGTWSKDANGFWSLTADGRKTTDGWYYANMLNSSTEYRWYHFDAKGIMATGWVKDRLDPSIWYYTGEAKDKAEGSLATGWVTDPQDGQKYYMDPATGQMSHGWVKIDNAWYYFCQRQYAVKSWAPNQTGHWTASNQTGHSFGSLYIDETTPDGYYVDGRGEWRQSSGSSSRSNPVPTPTPTPTPEPVMTATASTTTPQHAGQPFDTTGLTITVFKDGAAYKTVPYDDPSIVSSNVTVVGTTDNLLKAGANDIEISFVYYDPDVIIGQSITADVFTVDGLTYKVIFAANGHEFDTPITPITDVTYGSTITAPATPTTAGYAFGGWYKEAACTNAWNFGSDVVTADTTLYAKWILCYPEISGLAAALKDVNTARKAMLGDNYVEGDPDTVSPTIFNVPLKLNEMISGKPGGTTYDWPIQIYDVDDDPDSDTYGTVTFGPALGKNSILYSNIASRYLTWNNSYSDSDCTSANYATSRIRATLIGREGSNPSSYADESTCLTGDNCLLSCFPDSLTGKDKGADYKYGIVAKQMTVPTEWSTSSPYKITATTDITDKLWLFSANELYGGLPSDYSYSEEGGTQMQLPAILEVTYSSRDKLICNKEDGRADWRWFRSPKRNSASRATIIDDDGDLIDRPVYNSGSGLAPGFCLKVLN